MPTIDSNDRLTGRLRRIGPIGTTARIVVGILLLGGVIQGHLAGPFRPAAWALGLLGFPAVLLGWQWLRARRTPTRLQAPGPIANLVNVAACNWVLGRDDQIGCLLFWPIDHAERQGWGPPPPRPPSTGGSRWRRSYVVLVDLDRGG